MKSVRAACLALTLLLTPIAHAQSTQPARAPASGWAYAFLQAPYLIARNWVFSASGVFLLAPTPEALNVKLGGPPVDAQVGMQAMYDRIGQQGWELIQCGDAVIPGWNGTACVFRRPL